MSAPVQESDRDRDRYTAERHRIESAIDDGDLTEQDGDAILEFLDAIDPQIMRITPGETGTKAPSTLYTYAQAIRLVATRADGNLTEMSADDVNRFMDDARTRLSDNTLQARQSAIRQFYRWYDGKVAPEDIAMVSNTDSKVDDRYIFSRDEIDAMRSVIDNPRDRAVFDLLLYTGQRIRAILTLRIGDVDLKDGTFYLNTEAEGLKGASGKRPLLAAKGAVAEWLDYHPAGDDPDAYLITKLPDAAKGDPYTMLYRTTIQRRLKTIGEKSGIDQWEDRVHPHNFRHTFVTWAKRDLGMDDSTIKAILGQAPDSRIMESTYQHLSDDDVIKAAETAAGIRDPEEATDLTPFSCPVCDSALEGGSKACPKCGTVLSPDAAAAQEDVDSLIKKSYRDADPSDSDTLEKLDVLDELLNDPEVKKALLEKIE